MTKHVFVSARLVAQPGKADAVQAAIANVVGPTRLEEGCLRYVAHVSTVDTHRFLFFEEWASQAALDTHLASPHLTEFGETVGPLLAEPPQVETWNTL